MTVAEKQLIIPESVPLHSDPANSDISYFSPEDIIADGRYLVLGKFAANTSSLADVYNAVDQKSDSPVAVKVHREPTEIAQQRVLKELTAMVALNDEPGITPLHDMGTLVHDGTKKRYSVTLLGETLRDQIDNDGPLEVEQLVDMSAAVLRGLEAIHRGGLIHRDIKPANILLRGGDWEIFDFGSVEVIGNKIQNSVLNIGELAISEEVTDPCLRVSPRWAAPEVITAASCMPDPKEDVFSFGMTLYNAETGGLFPYAFNRSNPPLVEIADAVIHHIPERARTHNRSIPVELDELALECIDPNPENRPSIEELENRLESI